MSSNRSIPSLDGLRAFAVLTVILGHMQLPQLDHIYTDFIRNASLGVVGFFVLSGFLITGILLKEQNRTGTINLSQFYTRRSFRIFPAFYVYLIVIAILAALRIERVSVISWTSAATYTWNYVLSTSDSVSLAQTWSLSLEEQFYLVWPLVLLLCRKRTSLYIAIAAIALSPASRLLTYTFLPAYRGHIGMMFHTHIDAILTGSVIALVQDMGISKRLLENLAKVRWLIPVGIYFFFQLTLEHKFKGYFSLPIGMTLDEFSWAIVLLHVTRYPKLPIGRLLNWKPIGHIGRISYSLYLWQQIFTLERRVSVPVAFLCIWLCAEASYWLVEQPFLRLRDRFTVEKKPLPQPDTAAIAAPKGLKDARACSSTT